MKIKQTRQVRLDELLKYVCDKGIKDETFHSSQDGSIHINYLGHVVMYDDSFAIDELFTITEEVEITENTPLQRAMVIKNNLDFYSIKNRKINSLKTINIKFIYLQNSDGSIGDLIWSKERGLID